MSAVDAAQIAGAVVALIVLLWGIFIWLHGRRQEAAKEAKSIEREAEKQADELVVFIERGRALDDGDLPTWNVTVDNLGRQPISDVQVIYTIRAWRPLPRAEGEVGQRFALGPWLGPHTLSSPLVRPGEKYEQEVFWEGPVDAVSGPLLLGAKFRDYRGRLWVRGRDSGWRSVGPDEFGEFSPAPPAE